ncbi:DUF6343 family protein [Streptomyces sp. SL13]|jgi:hypothetical protein|uniref:DUF6343 family protein n=2 Tax=Streptantibioticus silvisoli TaxID=2705255 RepID=A0AA90H530_9ACTN|nr:DUF6343 family protein [Streptantibioticus silvisoli]MDI5974253.1 DUF6343 family protein [Streptantibioticus silvisoli]
MRTGDEPISARSPLRLRLGLALFGAACAVVGVVAFAAAGHPGWAGVCGAVVLVALADAGLVVRRMRQGAHFQPGRDIPPYHPDESPPPPDRRTPR